jgi:hypothetical protein
MAHGILALFEIAAKIAFVLDIVIFSIRAKESGSESAVKRIRVDAVDNIRTTTPPSTDASVASQHLHP